MLVRDRAKRRSITRILKSTFAIESSSGGFDTRGFISFLILREEPSDEGRWNVLVDPKTFG